MNSWYKEAFQSTLPIQGETRGCNTGQEEGRYFNPLSLYRERPRRVVSWK
ncbi:hypothetical protein CLOSCI_02074 [[Clostridium] scindens ATCC 35704]|nr:hypothetical protein CLOSCI_02074 [[Clostridium] scindens ATCC 35704]